MENNREKYVSNDLFKIGDLVEDRSTGETVQILDRGTNYITVSSATGPKKKWLSEVTESTGEKPSVEFIVTESGQIATYGFMSKNLNEEISEQLLEQFSEFDDLFIKHQVLKCLDEALSESIVNDRVFELSERIERYMTKKGQEVPFIVEAIKEESQAKKIAEIFSSALNVSAPTPRSAISECVSIMEGMNEKQKQILSPLYKVSSLMGLINEDVYDSIFDLIENNLDELELEAEDLDECFTDEDYSPEVLTETLSVQGRLALARDLRRRESTVTIKRERALSHSASASQLLGRARKLAITMLKRRMFRKPIDQLSRQEKERFEKGAGKRKAMIARLSQKLVSKVRMLQQQRLANVNAGTTAHSTETTHRETSYGGES